MRSQTALTVFGAFLALNLTGFAGAVVLQNLRGGVADEDKYGGLSESAFAARVVADGVAAIESAPVDAMAMEMVAKTESGDTFATMTVAVSEPQRAMDMRWEMDFELLRRFAPPDDAEEMELAAGMEELLGEFRVTQVGDHLVITLGGETYEQRGVADADFGSISRFVAEPVPGLAEQGQGESADPTGFFGALESSTSGLTVHQISEGKFEGQRAWRVEASFEDADAKGTLTFIAAKSSGLPLHAAMRVSDPADADIPPADITFRFTYGDAVVIALPSEDGGATRLPATFQYDLVDNTPTRIEGLVNEGSSAAPLDELDLRVVEFTPGSGDVLGPAVSKVRAALRLDAGTKADAGYELTFTDNGDGVLSAGDRFVVKAPAAKPFRDPTLVNGTWQPGVGVKFYDHWASAYEGTPGPGFAVGLVALAAVAFALVRRRKNDA